jgi:dephospho-CoA kinase
MKIIAIVGMTGAGKSEFSKFFGKDFSKIRFGDITDELLRQKGLEITEENEKKLRESLRKEHGMAAYAKLNLPKIEKAQSDIVIDGLYSWEEYVLLKEKFKNDLIVVAVYTPPEERYERLTEREVRSLTKEQARQRDDLEIERLNKAPPIAMADYTVLNVGTLYDLETKFDQFMEWLHERDEL